MDSTPKMRPHEILFYTPGSLIGSQDLYGFEPEELGGVPLAQRLELGGHRGGDLREAGAVEQGVVEVQGQAQLPLPASVCEGGKKRRRPEGLGEKSWRSLMMVATEI